MGIVSKIEVQKKDKNRVNIYLDEEFCCGLNMEVLLKHGIKKGTQLEKNFLVELMLESDKKTALSKACEYISKTQKTKHQIYDYLIKKGYNDVVCEWVISKMMEYNYIDDDYYVESYINQSKNIGKMKIQANLFARGIDKETIQKHLSTYESDKDVIMQVAQKYIKNKDTDSKTLMKLQRHLLSKGFTYEEISCIINNIRSE